MIIEQLIFYSFSAMAILLAILMITAKNPVRAVLFLVFTFLSTAGLWMLLESEFLSIVLVLVYVGAVMVFFLFVVMMLDIETAEEKKTPLTRYWPIGVGMGCVMFVFMALMLSQHFGLSLNPAPPPKATDYSHVKVIGELLYTQYLLPFEIAGVILLVAMIAAIGLAYRGPRTNRTQKVDWQVSVRKSDRLRIIPMSSNKGEPQ